MASDTKETIKDGESEDTYTERVMGFIKGLGCPTDIFVYNPCEAGKVLEECIKDQADIDLLHDILEDLPAYKSLMASDESDNPYGLDLITLHAIRMILQESKDAGYGKSWAKHGEGGVWLNAARKIDRLRTLALLVLSGSDKVTDENRISLIDTLIDLSCYIDMWISYIVKIRPDNFKQWLITRWCRSTGEDEGTILETLRNVGTKI
jgi:hypothetical protein